MATWVEIFDNDFESVFYDWMQDATLTINAGNASRGVASPAPATYNIRVNVSDQAISAVDRGNISKGQIERRTFRFNLPSGVTAGQITCERDYITYGSVNYILIQQIKGGGDGSINVVWSGETGRNISLGKDFAK